MHASSVRRWGQACAALLAGGALLVFPGEAARGAAHGLSLCLNTLVPALFPFMVLAVYVASGGAGELLGKPLRRPLQWLGLPPACAPAVLTALLGGYPVGAAGISRLLHEKRLTPAQARRAMRLCCLPGPAFLISAVGNGLLGSAKAGAALWVCVLLGAVLPLLFSGQKEDIPPPAPVPPGKNVFFSAVESAARSLFSMCALVVVFCTLQALLAAALGKNALLPALLEVTTGLTACKENGAPLWLFAFAAGWGGLCVHGQVFSFFRPGELKKAAFLGARLVHGVLSALLAAGFFRLFPTWQPALSAFATHTVTRTAVFSAAAPASAALLVLCGVFCLTANEKSWLPSP